MRSTKIRDVVVYPQASKYSDCTLDTITFVCVTFWRLEAGRRSPVAAVNGDEYLDEPEVSHVCEVDLATRPTRQVLGDENLKQAECGRVCIERLR